MTFKVELANLFTTTNSISNPNKQRIAVALGKSMNLKDAQGDPRNATADDLAQWLITMLKNHVLYIEDKTAKEAVASPPALPIDD